MAVDRNDIMAKALKQVQKGNYERALKELEPAIKAYPKDTNLLTRQGEWLARLGRPDQAVAVLQKVADVFAEKGFLKKSLAVYRQMTQLTPDNMEVHQKLADLFQQLGYFSEARGEYEVIASFYERKGDLKKSLEVMQQIVEIEPDNLANRIKLADHFAREQIFTRASEELEKVAGVLKEQNRLQEYTKVAERLLQFQPDNRDLALEVAQIYHAGGEPNKSLNILHALYKKDPKHIPTLELLAQLFTDMKQAQKSLAIWLELARIYQDQNDGDNRKRCLKHVMEIDPDNDTARAGLGLPLVAAEAPPPAASSPAPAPQKAKQPSESKPEAPAKPKKLPPHLEKIFTEVSVYVKYGLLDQAFEHIAKLLKEEPNNIEAHQLRVKTARDNKRQEVLILALAELARVFRVLGKEDEVHKVIAELETLSPDDRRLMILKNGGDEFPPLTDEEIVLIETGEFTQPTAGESGEASEADGDVTAITEAEIVEPKAQEQQHKFSLPPELAHAVISEPTDVVEAEVIGGEEIEELNELDVEELPQDGASADVTMQIASDEGFVAEAEGALDSVFSLDDDKEEKAVQLDDAPGEELGDSYEEAEFFVEQGLIEEAKEVYNNILEKYPNHAETLKRLKTLEEGKGAGSEISIDEDRLTTSEELLFDLSDEIGEKARRDSAPAGDSSKRVSSVFEQVRGGNIPNEEAENHINLGIAYREMGLLREAEEEFLQAVAHPSFAIQAYELIGRCRLDNKDYEGAIAQFKKALTVKEMNSTEALAIFYELGEAYLQINNKSEAYFYYAKVNEVNPNYRQVAERLKETQSAGKEIDTSNWLDEGDILSDVDAAIDENFKDFFDENESKKAK